VTTEQLQHCIHQKRGLIQGTVNTLLKDDDDDDDDG
jgi:hypothetical protein